MDPVTLRTQRLVLSTPGPDDIDAIHAACQDPDVQRWTTVPSPYEIEHAATFVAGRPAAWKAGLSATWAIREDGVLVGMVSLERIDAGAAEIGYWLAPAGRGRGLMREACEAVVSWALTPADDGGLGLERIAWRAVVGNHASAHVAQALGFRYEGTTRRGLVSPRGRTDGWLAGLLADDAREPQTWPIGGE